MFTLASVDTVVGVANIDDDNENQTHDWDDSDADDEEIVPLGYSADAFSELGDSERVRVELVGDVDQLRLWADGAVVLDAANTTVELDASVDGSTLGVEFYQPMASGALELSYIDIDGNAVESVTVEVHAAPLILNHHMQPAEWAVAVYTGRGTYGNQDFIDGFDAVLGDDFGTVSGSSVSYDVWIQDELEYGTMTAPGYEMQVVIDSIRSQRDQYLDSVPESEMWGPDTAVWTWGSGAVTSQDSFGNLEVSPPVTVDGVEYPFGRVYYGDTGSYAMTDDMQEMLDNQKVQAPFTLDIGWLCVGHVDEFMTFLPNPDAPKGFTLYVADIDVGRDFLESLDPSTELPLYDSGHGVDSIGDMLDHSGMWTYNRDLMDEHIEPNIDTLKSELGLNEADIIRVPSVFERSTACGGTALSLIPGTVNMQVQTHADGVGADLFIPDPFLREDVDDLGSDPFIAEFEAMLPSNLTPHWLDDWATYHLMWGEVHCGSNTRRTPVGQWWTDATHLLED